MESRASRIRQARASAARSETTVQWEFAGRVCVAAGIFLLLLFCGRVLKEPTEEVVQAWIVEDPLYEITVGKTAAWIEERKK